MSYGTQKLYGNGIDPATLGSAATTVSGFPLLLTAKSVTDDPAAASAAYAQMARGQRLHNSGGTHYIGFATTDKHDILNGALIETRQGSKGLMFGSKSLVVNSVCKSRASWFCCFCFS